MVVDIFYRNSHSPTPHINSLRTQLWKFQTIIYLFEVLFIEKANCNGDEYWISTEDETFLHKPYLLISFTYLKLISGDYFTQWKCIRSRCIASKRALSVYSPSNFQTILNSDQYVPFRKWPSRVRSNLFVIFALCRKEVFQNLEKVSWTKKKSSFVHFCHFRKGRAKRNPM